MGLGFKVQGLLVRCGIQCPRRELGGALLCCHPLFEECVHPVYGWDLGWGCGFEVEAVGLGVGQGVSVFDFGRKHFALDVCLSEGCCHLSGFSFQFSGRRFRVSNFRFRVSGLTFKFLGFEFRISDFGFRFQVSGLRTRTLPMTRVRAREAVFSARPLSDCRYCAQAVKGVM